MQAGEQAWVSNTSRLSRHVKEIHDWAGWFRELGRAIQSAGEDGLITLASQVDWGGTPELLKNGDQGIDPFSFLYSLAQKNTKNQRPRVYPSVAEFRTGGTAGPQQR